MKKLKKQTLEYLHLLYGKQPHESVLQRYEKEMTRIAASGDADRFHLAAGWVHTARCEGYPTAVQGDVGSSFLAFLMQITEINPLPPHHRCPCAAAMRISPIRGV